jgi:hypothetical protein
MVRAGEHDILFVPLNTRTPTPADRRVQAVFGLMLELDGLYRKLTDYKRANYRPASEFNLGPELDSPVSKFFRDSTMSADFYRFVEARAELNERLSRYTAHPKCLITPDSISPWEMYLGVDAAEFLSIRAIQRVAEAGNLDRFRRCASCQDWFLARVDHQHCCSLACRQKLHRSSPEFREHRRKYMIKHRRDEREREKREMVLARINPTTRRKGK